MLDESDSSTKNNKNNYKDAYYNGNNQVNYRETRNNFHNNLNKPRFEEIPPDLFTHPQIHNQHQQNRGMQNPNKNSNKPNNINQNINFNTYVINKKEAKKYEELLKYGNPISGNGDINNTHINSNSLKPIKMGKVILDPIHNNNHINNSGNPLNPLGGININLNNNSNKLNDANTTKKNFYSSKNKKMEVSFKATLKFSDDIGNNKIEISPNFNLNNQEN
jgi:hypothetical protein